jgi:uncharacterized Zn-finger protein
LQVCQKSFKRRGHLKEHLYTHMPRADATPGSATRNLHLPYACPECDKSFSKPSLLERHLRIHTGKCSDGLPACSKEEGRGMIG